MDRRQGPALIPECKQGGCSERLFLLQPMWSPTCSPGWAWGPASPHRGGVFPPNPVRLPPIPPHQTPGHAGQLQAVRSRTNVQPAVLLEIKSPGKRHPDPRVCVVPSLGPPDFWGWTARPKPRFPQFRVQSPPRFPPNGVIKLILVNQSRTTTNCHTGSWGDRRPWTGEGRRAHSSPHTVCCSHVHQSFSEMHILWNLLSCETAKRYWDFFLFLLMLMTNVRVRQSA